LDAKVKTVKKEAKTIKEEILVYIPT
jgi:hypothetical protein